MRAAALAVEARPRRVYPGARVVTSARVGELDDELALVRACAAGDGRARRVFQDRFAEDIYNFPVKIYGVSPDKAADFYVYVFERDRIFARLRTFEGRGGAQLRSFLAFQVLRGLFLDWQRLDRELETVSLSDPIGGRDGGRALEDVVAAGEDELALDASSVDDAPARELWADLAPEERLDLKLLSLLEHDLGPEDLRLLAEISRRSLDETLATVAEVHAGLCAKDERLSELTDELDSAWGWLVLRRRELQETEEKIRRMGPDDGSLTRQRLVERKEELEAAVAKRSLQRERILGEIRSFKMTTSYKDIARLKGSTVGTVCSRIFRLRARLEERWQGMEATA
jgi:RNA polymerase sigma factor (sigma-70 family)